MDKQFHVKVSGVADMYDGFDTTDTIPECCDDCDPMVAYSFAVHQAERGRRATIYYGSDWVMTLE